MIYFFSSKHHRHNGSKGRRLYLSTFSAPQPATELYSLPQCPHWPVKLASSVCCFSVSISSVGSNKVNITAARTGGPFRICFLYQALYKSVSKLSSPTASYEGNSLPFSERGNGCITP